MLLDVQICFGYTVLANFPNLITPNPNIRQWFRDTFLLGLRFVYFSWYSKLH